MISVQALSAILVILYCNLGLGSVGDDLYEKFRQKDYNLKLDREIVTFANKSIIDYNLVMWYYNRTQRIINVTMLFHIDVGNDLEIIVQAYKFLSNEYRVFPMHFEYNVCKGLTHDFGGIQSSINACGNLACPMKKNIRYHVCNCKVDETKYPPFMPSGEFKFQANAIYKDQLVLTVEVYVVISRKVKPERKYLG